jgi:hypothetical protein
MKTLSEKIIEKSEKMKNKKVKSKPKVDFKKSKTMTFTIDEDQVKKLEEWQGHIKEVFGNYGDYEYRFSSNGIGQIVTVYSELANVELDLTDIDKW